MTEHESRNPATGDMQADPQLQLSHGRASGLQITLVALGCAFILGIMIYGLNRPVREDVIASSPGQQTTGAAPAAEPAQTGGNVAGGENAAPKVEAAPQNEPARQPAPQQTKPGVTEDDSKR